MRRLLRILGGFVLTGVLLILGLAAIGTVKGPSPQMLKREEDRAASLARSKEIASEYVKNLISIKLTKSEWRKSGSVMIGTFTVRNDNTSAVKDVGIHCEVFGGSGTSLGIQKTTAYENFPPAKPRTVKDQNMGFVHSQAQTARCEVVSFAWGDGRPVPF